MSAADRVRRRVLYTGQVQGVFFRATTQQLAKPRPVVGWVRNRPDGRVEMEVEGSPTEVAALLDDVASHFRENITAVDIDELPPLQSEPSFDIRY